MINLILFIRSSVPRCLGSFHLQATLSNAGCYVRIIGLQISVGVLVSILVCMYPKNGITRSSGNLGYYELLESPHHVPWEL